MAYGFQTTRADTWDEVIRQAGTPTAEFPSRQALGANVRVIRARNWNRVIRQASGRAPEFSTTSLGSYPPPSVERGGLGQNPLMVADAVGNVVSSVFGGGVPKQRASQLQQNAKLYQQAIGGEIGSLYALGFLKSPGSTPFPEAANWTDPVTNAINFTPAGGGTGKPWGDGVVQHDALNKYNAAKALLQRNGWSFDASGKATVSGSNTALGPPTAAVSALNTGGVANGVGTSIAQAITAVMQATGVVPQAPTPAPGTPLVPVGHSGRVGPTEAGLLSGSSLPLIIAVGVGAYLLFGRKR